MIDFLLNSLALVLSLLSVWLCTNPSKKNTLGCIRLGCLIGVFACALNIYLQLNGAPWSALALSVAILFMNLRGANIPALVKRLLSK